MGGALHVLVVCEYFYPDVSGGTPTVLSELFRYLKDHHPSMAVRVLTSNHLYRGQSSLAPLPLREDWEGVLITRFVTARSNRAGVHRRAAAGLTFSAKVLFWLMSHRSYDVVVVVTNPPSVPPAVALWSRVARFPFVYLIHDLYPDLAVAGGRLRESSLATRIARKIQKATVHSAAVTVVLGRCMKDVLQARYAANPDRIRVIPNWAPAESCRPQENAEKSRRGSCGFRIAYTGNLGEQLDVDVLIACAKILQDEQCRIEFLLVGDGVKKTDVLRGIQRFQLKNVQLLPQVTQKDVPAILASADAVFVPLAAHLKGLGTPSKLYSSMASGRPILALVPQGSEPSLVVTEEGCGLVESGPDPLQLADAVKWLAGNRASCADMGQRARRAVEAKYRLEVIGEEFFTLLECVAGNEARSRREGG